MQGCDRSSSKGTKFLKKELFIKTNSTLFPKSGTYALPCNGKELEFEVRSKKTKADSLLAEFLE